MVIHTFYEKRYPDDHRCLYCVPEHDIITEEIRILMGALVVVDVALVLFVRFHLSNGYNEETKFC